MKIVKFLPAIFFFMIWGMLLIQGQAMKESMNEPASSEKFINTMGKAIDNPWTHNSALRLFFKKLLHDNASNYIWENSEYFGWALWKQYQYDGSLEIMLSIFHSADNNIAERTWANMYAAIHPDSPLARQYLEHAKSGHQKRQPLELGGEW